MVRSLVKRMWHEDDGVVQAASHLLLVLIIAIGGIVGLSTFRIVIIQSFGDVVQALLSLNQSYSITVGTVSSSYTDLIATSLPAGARQRALRHRRARHRRHAGKLTVRQVADFEGLGTVATLAWPCVKPGIHAHASVEHGTRDEDPYPVVDAAQ